MLTTNEWGGLVSPLQKGRIMPKSEPKEVIVERNMMVRGQPRKRGDKLQIPKDLSLHDARYLVNIGKAKWPAKPASKKDEDEEDEQPTKKETATSKSAAKSEKR